MGLGGEAEAGGGCGVGGEEVEDVGEQGPVVAEVGVAEEVGVDGGGVDGVEAGKDEDGFAGAGVAVEAVGGLDGFVV